jgi:hypothetical protein
MPDARPLTQEDRDDVKRRLSNIKAAFGNTFEWLDAVQSVEFNAHHLISRYEATLDQRDRELADSMESYRAHVAIYQDETARLTRELAEERKRIAETAAYITLSNKLDESERQLSEARAALPDDDSYVAWLRYRAHYAHQHLVVCDSDAPGAFKVYRRAALGQPEGGGECQGSE